MPVFIIAWTELYGFEAKVVARDLDHAKELVKDDPCLYASVNDAEYIDGTMEINHNYCLELKNDDAEQDS